MGCGKCKQNRNPVTVAQKVIEGMKTVGQVRSARPSSGGIGKAMSTIVTSSKSKPVIVLTNRNGTVVRRK